MQINLHTKRNHGRETIQNLRTAFNAERREIEEPEIWHTDEMGITQNPDISICWGTTNLAHADGTPILRINNQIATHRCYLKKKARQLLYNLNLSLPVYEPDQLPVIFKQFAIYIGRERNHQQGTGFHVIEDTDALNAFVDAAHPKYGYASPFVHKLKEYRVQVLHNRVVAISEKVPNDPDEYIWNHDTSQINNVRWGDWPLDVARTAILAANALQIDCTAVDIMVGFVDPGCREAKHCNQTNHWVAECNTAPSISAYRAKCLTRAIYHDYYALREGTTQHHDITPHIYDPESLTNYRDFIHPGLLFRDERPESNS